MSCPISSGLSFVTLVAAVLYAGVFRRGQRGRNPRRRAEARMKDKGAQTKSVKRKIPFLNTEEK